MLATKLAKVVTTTQPTFIKGRNLVDGVMVMSEVIDMAKKTYWEFIILGDDFEKTYDLLNFVSSTCLIGSILVAYG